MDRFEREPRREDRPPAWRSSEGRMWEVSPKRKKEGRDHLTGYEPHSREATARPREVARMGGSYGDVAIGVSRKKELTLVVSKRRSREGPAATREEQTLLAGSARPMDLTRGNVRVNAHDPKKSAVAFRASHRKSPRSMMARLKEVVRERDQQVLEEQVPFLSRAGERKALRRLQKLEEDLLAKRERPDRPLLRQVNARKQALRQVLTEKTAQERRLRLLLQKAQEASRRRAGELERADWLSPLLLPLEEEPPPPEGEGEAPEDAETLADALLAAALEALPEEGEAPPSQEETKF